MCWGLGYECDDAELYGLVERPYFCGSLFSQGFKVALWVLLSCSLEESCYRSPSLSLGDFLVSCLVMSGCVPALVELPTVQFSPRAELMMAPEL